MKKITLFLLAVFCLTLVGCSKDAEVEAFITEWDATTSEIVKKIDENPSAEGVDEAQKVFDGKKDSLKTKWDAIKTARGMQVSEATQKKLNESADKNMKAIMEVSTKNAMKLGSDPEAANKFKKLMNDYGDTFKM